MSDGQLAMNTNLVSPGLFLKDSNGDLVKVGPVHVGTTAPNATPGAGGQAGNSKGEQWLDTSSSRYVFKIWDGTAWRTEDGEFVNTSGDTMTGALVMDNQQQVRFRETTANGTNYIALQAPASVASDKTITLPDVTGTVVTTGDTGSVTSTMLLDGTILNADINASAAIAGTKVAPNFGSQNILTTGTATAASLSPTGSSVPSNGLYLPAANSVAISTNAVERVEFGTSEVVFNDGGENYDFRIEGDTNANLLFVDASTDRVGLGTSSPLGSLHIESPATTAGWQLRLDSVGLANESGFYRTAADNYEMVLRNGLGGLSYITNTGGASTATLEFNVQGSERARIDSSGRLLVGASSIILGSPQAIIEKSTSDLDILRVQCGALETSSNLAGIAFGHGPSGARPKVAIASVATGTFGRGSLAFFIDQVGDNNSVSSTDEVARIDSSGRLLVGTSSAVSVNGTTAGLELHALATTNGASASIARFNNDAGGPQFNFGKSRSGTLSPGTVVQSNDNLGEISFCADDGTDINSRAASIAALVDGTPGANDMPGRLVFSTTADGESSPTEAMRITNDRVIAYNQPTPTSKSAAATLTITELKTGIIQYTGAVATLTLPTGTLMEGGFSGIYTNMAFEWSVINTGTGICTIGAGTAHTIVGSATVAIGASARFVSRRTASNTFVSYCLS